MSELAWLQKWYEQQCNGIWEHSYGVTIGTLDNPGWAVRIELKGTPFENRQMGDVNIEKGEHDWIVCRLADSLFQGHGDPSKLEAILRVFRDWLEPAG